MVCSRSKASVESSEWLNVDTRLKRPKFALRLQNYFIRKKTQFLILFKNFLRMLGFPKSLFRSQSKALIEPSEAFNISGKCQIWSTNKKLFFRKSETNPLFKNVLHILEIPLNLFSNLSKASIKSSEPWNIGSRLYNTKFCWRNRTIFPWNGGWPWNFSKTLFVYWSPL